MRDSSDEMQVPRPGERGFTLVELAIACLILLVGIAAVVQLVPTAMQSNLNNRFDTTATVLAQRLLDLMINTGVSNTTLTDPTGMFPCGGAAVCRIDGGVANPPAAIGDFQSGSPILPNGRFNFAVAPTPGCGFFYQDPNDPSRAQYDIRWMVVTNVRNMAMPPTVTPTIVSKRYIVGVQRRAANTLPTAISLSAWVSR